MTVEASLVMPIVLFTLVLLMQLDLRAHDIVLQNLVANEVTELKGHLPEDADTDLAGYAAERLSGLLSGTDAFITAEKHPGGSTTTIRSGGKTRKLTDTRLRPEELMRAMTLAEEFVE